MRTTPGAKKLFREYQVLAKALKQLPGSRDQRVAVLDDAYTQQTKDIKDEIQKVEDDEKDAVKRKEEDLRDKKTNIDQTCQSDVAKARKTCWGAIQQASAAHVGPPAAPALPANPPHHLERSLVELNSDSLTLKKVLKPGDYGWVLLATLSASSAETKAPRQVVVKAPVDAGENANMAALVAEMHMKEVITLRKLASNPHPNVVEPLAIHENQTITLERDPKANFNPDNKPPRQVQRCIVVPYYGDEDLGKFIVRQKELTGKPTERTRCHLWELAQMACDIAAAVEHVHTLGIWHRDLHPGNIMVEARRHSRTGSVKLIDFSHTKHTGSALPADCQSQVGDYNQDKSCESAQSHAALADVDDPCG